MPTAYSILLAIPGKKTTELGGSLKQSLLQVIRTKFGDVGASDCYPAIVELNELRQYLQRHVGSAGKPEVPPLELREKLSEYLRCLASLIARFPILEGVGTSLPCFSWHDAFHPNRCTAQHSISLERAGCLFNLGATMCQQALACDKSTPEGSRAASLLFQEAAGVFTALQNGEAAKILAPQPDDMSPVCLGVLTKLMLIQAQQCEYRKAVLERVNHRETARLSEQLSVQYDELRRDFSDPGVSKIFDKCMVAYTTFKASLFHAEAIAQIGKALHNEGSVGKAIPVLKQASGYLLGTKELAKDVSEAMAGSVVKIQDAIKKSLALAKRDNTIAHQVVPASIEVDIALLGALLAQPIHPAHIDAPGEEGDLLANLGPRSRPLEYFQCMTTLIGHTGEVRGVAISADGDHIVTGSADGTVRIWGVPEELLATLHGHMDEVTCVGITPDCTACISGSRDKTAKIWDLANGLLKATLVGHTAVVSCLAISPDGVTLLLGSYDDTISIWDLASAQRKGTLVGHKWGVTSISMSVDRHTCVSGSGDETIKLWDLNTCQLKASSKGIEAYVNCVAANPLGATCVSTSWDDSIRIWDTSTMEVKASIRSDLRANFCVAITPAGTSCITGSDDDRIRLWDLGTGHLKGVMDGHTNDVISLAISPDGTICVSGSGDGTVKVWDIAGEAYAQMPDEMMPEL